MTNLAHVAETAVLVLIAYLIGCVLGYGARRILHAARGTRIAAVAPLTVAAEVPVRARTPAARLAATASNDDVLPAIPVAPSLPAKIVASVPVATKVQTKPRMPAKAKVPPKPKVVDPKPVALHTPRRPSR